MASLLQYFRFKLNYGEFNLKYYLLLSIGLMSYGHNNIVDIIIVISLSILLFVFVNQKEFLYSYFGLLFFEPVLNLPYMNGSFFRIFQLLFLFRIIIEIKNKKRIPLDFNMNGKSVICFLFLSFFYTRGMQDIASVILNYFILFYIVTYVGEDKDEKYSSILAVVAIFVVLSGLYGLCFVEGIDYGYTVRYSSAIGDPNYSSFFYTLGLFSLIGTHSINNKLKVLLTSILCLLLILSQSITGIFGTIILFIIYIGIKNIKFSLSLLAVIILFFLIFINIDLSFIDDSALYGFQHRIVTKLESSDISVITSQRTDLIVYYTEYFNELPLQNKLFGGNDPVNSGEFRDEMVANAKFVSHNSFIDMLFMIGILGTVFVGILYIKIVLNLMFLYKKAQNPVYLSMVFVKFTLFYYSLTLSLYPLRYFYAFFNI